jgi:hypothetical protein
MSGTTCPVCSSQVSSPFRNAGAIMFDCPRCGSWMLRDYMIERVALDDLAKALALCETDPRCECRYASQQRGEAS